MSRSEITPVWSAGDDDWLRTDDALIKLESKNSKRDASQTALAKSTLRLPDDQVAGTALSALGRDMFAVFDTYPQIIVPIDDMDWAKIRGLPITQVQARFENSKIILQAEGFEPLTCNADGWYGGLCTLWLRLCGRAGRLLTYPQLGTMLPNGQEFRCRLIKENRDLYLQLCGSVCAAGDHAAAGLMLHAYNNAGWYRQDTPFDGQDEIVASLPRDLFEDINYQKRTNDFANTTILSAARHAIESGLLTDANPRVRLEMLGLIHGTVISTNKKRQFFEKILPSILALQNDETVASLTEQVDSVVEAFIIAGLVEAEVKHTKMADVLEPIIRNQITRCVNLPLNHSRLIEVIIHNGEAKGAATEIAAFKAEYGADFMLPGLYANRLLYRNVVEAVAAMHERARDLE